MEAQAWAGEMPRYHVALMACLGWTELAVGVLGPGVRLRVVTDLPLVVWDECT